MPWLVLLLVIRVVLRLRGDKQERHHLFVFQRDGRVLALEMQRLEIGVGKEPLVHGVLQ